MSLTVPNLEFTARDFDTNVATLIEVAKRSLPGQWTSFQDGDFGQALLELIAYDTSILSFVQDQQAKERFLVTATQYESAILFARQQGYRVRWGSPATIDVWAEATSGNGLYNSRIKNGTPVVQSDGLLWEVVGNYEIPPGRVTPVRSVVSWGQISNGASPAYLKILPGASQATLVNSSGNRLPDTVSFEGRGVGPGNILTLTGVLSDGVIGAPPDISNREFAVVDVGSYKTDLVNGGVLFLDRAWGNEVPFIGAFLIESRSISLMQGTTNEEVFQAPQSDRENFLVTCSFPGISSLSLDPVTPSGSPLVTSDGVGVAVNGQLWHETSSLSLEGPGSKTYETLVDGNKRLNVRFGDGIHGAVVPAGAAVAIKYRTSDGIAGNVKRGSFSAKLTASGISLQLTNPYNVGSGGRERESLHELKAAIISATRTNDRAVNLSDFESLAVSFRSRQFGCVSAVKVEKVPGVARNNVVKVSAWTRGNIGQLVQPSVGLMGDLRSYLTARAMVTDEVIVVAGRTFVLPVAVRYKFNSVSPTEAYDGVRSAINDVFRSQSPGSELQLGDLYEAVEKLDFIDHCSFCYPTTSVPPVSGAYVNSLSKHSSTTLTDPALNGSSGILVTDGTLFALRGPISVFELGKIPTTSIIEGVSANLIKLQFDMPTTDTYDNDFAVVVNSDYWAEGWSADLPVDLFIRIDSGSSGTRELVERKLRDWFRWFVLPGRTLLKTDIEAVVRSVPNVLSATVSIGNPTSTAEHVLVGLEEKPVLSTIQFL